MVRERAAERRPPSRSQQSHNAKRSGNYQSHNAKCTARDQGAAPGDEAEGGWQEDVKLVARSDTLLTTFIDRSINVVFSPCSKLHKLR